MSDDDRIRRGDAKCQCREPPETIGDQLAAIRADIEKIKQSHRAGCELARRFAPNLPPYDATKGEQT